MAASTAASGPPAQEAQILPVRVPNQEGGGNQPPEKPRCPTCGKQHLGVCDAGPCTRCNGQHRPNAVWCKHCKKCGLHKESECHKRPRGQAPPPQPNPAVVQQIFLNDPAAAFSFGAGLTSNRRQDKRQGRRAKRDKQKKTRGNDPHNQPPPPPPDAGAPGGTTAMQIA